MYASQHTEESEIEAKKYISDMKLTKEDVKLVIRGEMILVIARKDIERSKCIE